MKYISNNSFNHAQDAPVGVLITNLGTPTAAEPGALRRYLREFLSDPRVVEIPRLLWWLILHCVVLVVRPRKSAAAYRTIWTEQGSPLLVHTRAQAAALQANLQQRYGDQVMVDYAMRYGEPSIGTAIQALLDRRIGRLLIVPLYPQYNSPTTASTFDALAKDFTQRRALPDLRFVSQYHDFPPYIAALASSIQRHWASHGRADKLVFSYHGEPQHCVDQGDPYQRQCLTTTKLVAQLLELTEAEYVTTFQSRFGAAEWLRPYTDQTLKAFPDQGVESVQICCPGFSSDCLETLEEIEVENREYFIEAGGKRYEYIACLNSEAEHIDALSQLISTQLGGWVTPTPQGEQTCS